MKLLVPLFIGIILGPPAYGTGTDSVYEYHLEEVHHAVSGVIGIDTARGERVRAVVEELVTEEEHEGLVHPAYLQLTFRRNIRSKAFKSTKNMHVFMTTAKSSAVTSEEKTALATTRVLPPQPTSAELEPVTQDSSEAVDITMPTQALAQTGGLHTHGHSIHLTHHTVKPHSVRVHKREVHGPTVGYNVEESSAFYVDPMDNYVKVSYTAELENHTSVEFYVYLTDENGKVVSNPLPFTVHIERPVEDDSYPLGPAVFAGVLVLVIVFLAFFIPFVTRAKRRYKQGKPVFKMGPHQSNVDLENASMSRASSEPNWYGNNAYYSYEEEIEKEKNEFSSEIKEYSNAPTLQLTKPRKNKETSSVVSGSSGIDVSSQFAAEGTAADEVMSQRL